MALVRWKALQDQARQTLVAQVDLHVVPRLHKSQVFVQGRQAIAGMRGQLLAHWDFLLREVPVRFVELHRLMGNLVATPPHGLGEVLRGHMGQQMARDRQEQVRRQVGLLAGLVVHQVFGSGASDRPSADLLVRQLAGQGRLSDRPLQRDLDGLQNILHLFGKVPPPWVDVVAQVRRAAVERDEHCARPLVRLALGAFHRGEALVVAMAPPIPLEEARRPIFELPPQHLQALDSHLLDFLVDQLLHRNLALETAPIPLQE
mmetsp:Transcript_104049/g.301006  ORF Transcript_104049/g.301006 Transcript_104049/m.301006 type:complete len:260 (-) Transcript_104049:687-1466(-)